MRSKFNKKNVKKEIAIFKGKEIRRHWDDEKELWYFSVVDVVRILTNSVDAGAYWRKLKQRLKKEGSKVVTKCHGLKFMARDGKYYVTDAADTEAMLRLVQSIPSPNAEPFKLWLAQVGYQRLEETADPEAYSKAAKELKVAPGECLVFEDAVPGVRSGKLAC
jgi:DNA-damage-inducible protein D